jgi:CheY-like chemotaxis protein
VGAKAIQAILATSVRHVLALGDAMQCPKCNTSFDATPDAGGLFTCPSCGTRLRSRPVAPAATSPTPAPPPSSVTLDAILAELRAVRGLQEEALSLLRARPGAGSDGAASRTAPEDDGALVPRPVLRARRQKTVLLIDDQEESRKAAATALEQARVPCRAFPDGPRGLEGLAAERPDVVILELGIGGAMAGRDVINMIRATMEWVDIPIVLYTRLPVESQKEARTVHGADDVVLKGPGSADAVVAHVIQLFRRG